MLKWEKRLINTPAVNGSSVENKIVFNILARKIFYEKKKVILYDERRIKFVRFGYIILCQITLSQNHKNYELVYYFV